MSATSETDPEPDEVRTTTQAAVDATATLYATDPGLDVEQRLRIEMNDRGLDAVDAAWVDEVARRIRSGHHVQVGLPEQGAAGS